MLGWTIGEAARRAGVSRGTIRLWEHQGLVRPGRTPGGIRVYDDETMQRIQRIARLRKVEGLNVPAILGMLRRENGDANDRASDGPLEPSYGPRLRRLRRNRGLTLAEVAGPAGVSSSFLSALERGQTGASIPTLNRILAQLGTSRHAILAGKAQGDLGQVSRSNGRDQVHDPFGAIVDEQLVPPTAGISAMRTVVQPGGGSAGSYAHDGEEFIYVLSGMLEVTLEEVEIHRIEVGDCLYFASTVSHRWVNAGDEPATVLWVNTPPTF